MTELETLAARIALLEDALGKVMNSLGIKPYPTASSAPSMRRIMAVTGEYFGTPLRNILCSSRNWDDVHARQVAMYLAKTLTTNTLPAIGREFGRDHTTVLHAVRKIEKNRKISSELEKDITTLSRELTSLNKTVLQNPPGAPLGAVAVTRPPEPVTAPFSSEGA